MLGDWAARCLVGVALGYIAYLLYAALLVGIDEVGEWRRRRRRGRR